MNLTHNSSNLFDEFICLRKYFNGLNLSEEYLNQSFENFCGSLINVEYFLNFLFRHVSLVILALLIVISIFGNIKENYKWLILHSASWNFLIMAFVEYASFKTVANQATVNLDANSSPFYVYFFFIAGSSMFPLALNRCAFLYFPHFYEKAFKKFGVIVFLISYDIAICALYFIITLLRLRFVETIGKFGLMAADFLLSIFLYARMQKMIHLAKTPADVKNTIVEDLRRVSFLCSLQAFMFICFMVLMIINDFLLSNMLLWTYLWAYVYQLLVYEFVVTIDSFLLLVMLKSYKNAMKGFFQKIFHKVFDYFERSNAPETITNFTRTQNTRSSNNRVFTRVTTRF